LYLAPELEEGLQYNNKVDIYALGLIYFEMLNKFATQHQRYKLMFELKKKNELKEPFTQQYPTESKLIIKMVERNHSSRLSCKKIFQSEEFKELNE
jgi:serine/threonine protein kinase